MVGGPYSSSSSAESLRLQNNGGNTVPFYQLKDYGIDLGDGEKQKAMKTQENEPQTNEPGNTQNP